MLVPLGLTAAAKGLFQLCLFCFLYFEWCWALPKIYPKKLLTDKKSTSWRFLSPKFYFPSWRALIQNSGQPCLGGKNAKLGSFYQCQTFRVDLNCAVFLHQTLCTYMTPFLWDFKGYLTKLSHMLMVVWHTFATKHNFLGYVIVVSGLKQCHC